MRILILTISYPPNVGGVETHLRDLTQWLNNRPDLDVEVLTYQPITTNARGPACAMEDRVRVTRISWIGHNLFHRLESKPLLQFLYLAPRLLLAAIFHILKRGKFDVIHAHGLAAIWIAGQLKRLWKTPVLGSIHAIYSFPASSVTAARMVRVLKSADHVLTLSDASRDQLCSYGLLHDHVGRFTYWIDQQVFFPQPIKEMRLKHDLPADKMICLFVGRLLKIKGLEILINLAERHPDILFLTAGEGPMENECLQAAKRLPNFRHLGCIANHKLSSFYSAADLLLVPSLYEEGFGRVVCEAFSCGLPVIASNRGGLKEAVETGVGLRVEPTVDAFSSAIAEWRKGGDSISAARHKCRDLAEKKFGFSNAQVIEDSLRLFRAQNSTTPALR